MELVSCDDDDADDDGGGGGDERWEQKESLAEHDEIKQAFQRRGGGGKSSRQQSKRTANTVIRSQHSQSKRVQGAGIVTNKTRSWNVTEEKEARSGKSNSNGKKKITK